MKDSVEMKFVASNSQYFNGLVEDRGYWLLTIKNDFLGEQTVKIENDIALTVALAIATAKNVGRQEGYPKKKKNVK